MGYSLGGCRSPQAILTIQGANKQVVGRYLIGLLQSRTPSFFEKYRPGTFSTFATPVSSPSISCLLSPLPSKSHSGDNASHSTGEGLTNSTLEQSATVLV
jgi:hypothetical protein